MATNGAFLLLALLFLVHPAVGALSSVLSIRRRLRLAGTDDLAAVARLQIDTFDPEPQASAAIDTKPSLFDSLFRAPTSRGDARTARADRLALELAERVAKGSDIWLVEEEEPADNQNPLGTADLSDQELLLPTHGLDPDSLYLSAMAVAPAVRRSGIGLKLLKAALDRATDRGAEGVWLHVERSNAAAIALYERCGFVRQPDSPRLAAFTNALHLQQKEPMLYYKQL